MTQVTQVNRVQTQLNHVLTQGSKLDASGDWDQQANWSNRGIPLWVCDDKVGSDALSLKEEETFEKGQTAEALAPAKRKSTGGELAPKKKKTASKPRAVNRCRIRQERWGRRGGERRLREGGSAGLPGQGSEESGSKAEVRGNWGPSSIPAASPSVRPKKRARKATA